MLRNLLFYLYNLDLKKALGASFVLSLFLSVPLIYLLLQREGQIFTEAGRREETTIVDESKVPYPEAPPQIIHIDKFYGKPGDSVLVYGKNFAAAQKESQILLNNQPVSKNDIVYWSDEELEFSLPANVGLYQVSILVNGSRANWYGKVNVFDENTTPEVTLNEKTGFIKVDSKDIKLNIVSLNDNVRVFGTQDFAITTKNIPIELINSSVILVEVLKGGIEIPFKVINQ